MAIKIPFDVNHNPILPTIILANRNGYKLGALNGVSNINIAESISEVSELHFNVSKYHNGIKNSLWDSIQDFKLIYCNEWDYWFEIEINLKESTDSIKSVTATALCESELSQTMLFGYEINTEEDIARDDYEIPTTIYNIEHPEASLLNRILEKAPHYSISHVDSTLMNIQRTFKFDDKSIKDCIDEVAEEVGFIVKYGNNSTEDETLGKVPARTISIYDYRSTCNECGFRGEYIDVCPKCGSTDIESGYGEDTTIFVSRDNLTEEIVYTSDTDSIKNCFKLEAGDDLMTSTVINCNPNGSQYIWYISDDVKSDMTDELVERLNSYDELYQYYSEEYLLNIDTDIIEQYNELVLKYRAYDGTIPYINESNSGYSALMEIVYNVIDFDLYLNSSLMPTYEISETNAESQAELLTSASLTPCAVSNISSISHATVDSNVLSIAKVLVSPNYSVKVKSSTYDTSTYQWSGVLTVTNYSDSDDTADSGTITLTITDNYEYYLKQKIEKSLKQQQSDTYDIISLFDLTYAEFVIELKKYALNLLTLFHDACQSCLDILVEQGVSDMNTWGNSSPNLYQTLYLNYLNRLNAIEDEISVRENEVAIIDSMYEAINEERNNIQEILDFEDYLGERLWKQFCAYRREQRYSNSNYISDGLSNTELFSNAREFLETAESELINSATLQHSISSTLKNLLVLKQFEKLLDYFEIGNWLRIEVEDKIYKLRLISYEIDFNKLEEIDVEFSDVILIDDDKSHVLKNIENAASMASSYASVEHQATQSQKNTDIISSWQKEGLNATLLKIVNADSQDMVYDSHGMLFRQYDDITETYLPTQLKIINSTIAVTDDNWESTKTAIGQFIFYNPETNSLETAYGINGEVIVGKLIFGENLSIYNSSGNMTFDADGLTVTNGVNTFNVNPSETSIVKILKTENNVDTQLFGLDVDGNLTITGSIINGSVTSATDTTHSGVYVGFDGINVSGGTVATTAYFTQSAVNIGNKLVWNGTSLSVTGNIYASGGSFGASNPFIIGDNGIDGTYTTGTTASITTTSSYDLLSSGSYLNNFTISLSKSGESDTTNNITLYLNYVDLDVSYSYSYTVTTETTTINDDGTTSTTTTTTTVNVAESSTIRILSQQTNVSNSVTVTLNSGVKRYQYTYTISSSDMTTYLRNLVKNGVSSIPSSVSASSITISGAVANYNYSYYFSSYKLYTHIGTDYFNYSDIFTIRNNLVSMSTASATNLTVTSSLSFSNNVILKGTMASSDYWRIRGAGSNGSGYMEIATAVSGNEPIYVRQYTGNFVTLQRTFTLLDGSGNTTIPGVLSCNQIKSISGNFIIGSNVNISATDVYLGNTTASATERRLRFTASSGTYTHASYIYGGNSSSSNAIGIYDGKNNRSVLYYNDVNNYLATGLDFYFKDYSGSLRHGVASAGGDTGRVAYFGSNTDRLYIYAQWGNSSFASCNVTVTSSDIRLKENIANTEVNSALDVLNNIVLHSFDWKNGRGHQKIGFVADELELLDPKFSVGGGYLEDGSMDVKSVDDFYLLGYAIKAIQELSSEVKKLKSIISN